MKLSIKNTPGLKLKKAEPIQQLAEKAASTLMKVKGLGKVTGKVKIKQ